ncbi:DUF2269 domain-containing protein [Labrenzia sp. PHM005]|uniref:DUF2269 family protein n=1 Tax=Labrenzia sp. PHM005 TaxID=2590016 RepID=UPI00114027EE|nr:DUF2269 domain-containing protein [Labrenzia sp. PHM005]QDG74783.1 DUF2269 domain-containing protein [Labrenzia sp. PHM005]
MTYFFLKYVHVIGAVILLGTGTGIAFFMLMAHRSRDPAFIAKTSAVVVAADTLFTATAVIAQPVSGYLLIREVGYPMTSGWILASLALYGVAGAFWLPVVWFQIRMRDLAKEAAANDTRLPVAYYKFFRWWFAFGFPGFGSVMAIFWLMIAKPDLW